MGTLVNGLKDIFSPEKATGTNVMLCGNDGTPDGHTTLNNLKNAMLTFDTTPTVNSTNPVTSAGIKAYVDTLSDVPIPFESDSVKQIIVEKYGGVSGGITGIKGFKGEITFRQAASVIETTAPLFYNTGVSGTFNECKYFKNLLVFRDNAWQNVGISSIIFPESLTTLAPNVLAYTSNNTLYVEFPASFNYIDAWNINVSSPGVTFKFHSSTPPTLANNAMISKVGKVYVPSAYINNWKAVDYWNSYGENLIGF